MQISSRFTIAVHILICVDLFGKHEPATSESLAGSYLGQRSERT